MSEPDPQPPILATTPDPELLEVLRALKPGAIYSMASPNELKAAAALYSQEAIASFHWGESGQLLEARMAEKTRPSVLFSCERGQLKTTVVSPASHSNRLILAAIMTVVRVLSGSKFHQTDLPVIRVEKFRRQLRVPAVEKSRARVILRESPRGGSFDLDYDSGRREASWRVDGPLPGMEWLVWQEREPERVGEAFCRWVQEDAGITEVEIRTDAESIVLTGLQTANLKGSTQFEIRDGEVQVRRAVWDEKGNSREPFLSLGYGLVFLPAEKTMARIQPAEAWEEFERMGDSGSGRLKFPAQAFCLLLPPAAVWTLLGPEGLPVELVPASCQGKIEARSDGQIVRLSLRLTTERNEGIPLHCHLADSFQALFGDGPYALLMKSPVRRLKLAELLGRFALLEDGNEPEAFREDAAQDPTFTSRSMHGDDAVRCLDHLGEYLRRLNEIHLVASGPADNNPWIACSGAGRALGRTLAAVVQVFPEADILRTSDLSYEIPALRFFECLPTLIEKAQSLGIKLQVDGQKPQIEKLTVSVRVFQEGNLDWFELHPEARAAAFTIPCHQWENVLRSGYFRTEDGTVLALDADSLARLRQVAMLTETVKPVRLPRLRLFDWLALRGSGVVYELPSDIAAILDSLQKLETLPHQPLPTTLKAELREYQHHGYDWLSFLYLHRFGACLADDMGLGKTLQAITLLAAIKEGILTSAGHPHLLVLPPTLLFNWQSEIAKFAPSLKIHEYTGHDRSTDFDGADVVMTTYELVRRDIETLSALSFDLVIFDEAQAIKNSAAARAQAASQLQARFRLCLTGTPMENHLGEFHSIMETAVPGLFGNRREFLRDQEAGKPVLARARPFLLRRTKEKILSELPPKVESDAYFSLSESQREFYTRTVGEVRREVLSAYEDRPAQQAGIMALAALLRVRQICIAPALLSEEFGASSPKIEYLIDQLTELTAEGHAALVFSQFVKALDLVGDALKAAGLSFVRLDGSIPTKIRKSLVTEFQSGQSSGIFLISLKTGGAGLNLTRASYVYHLDPWWNPAVENQASDRVHRIGQKRSVFVQRLLMRHTIEEKMMSLKARKQALFSAVLDEGEISDPKGSAALSASDFQFLLES